ncbi:MAG: cellulose-binding protein [Bacteroidota bacterium]
MKNKQYSWIYAFAFVLFTVLACEKETEEPESPINVVSNVINVDLEEEYQHIVGFGGCNGVFRGAENFPKERDMQNAYGMGETSLGLSIFRVSIHPKPDRWPAIAEVAKYAQDRGALVFASPWDAPSDMLDPNHNEKRILPSKYDAYVDHLNRFDDFMTNNGVNLHAISIQNEPDIGEWTQWTIAEVNDFVKNHADGINNRVITAESFNFNRNYYNDILNDPESVENIDIVGGHIYGNGLGEFPLAVEKGKEIWMTEYLLNETSGNITGDDWSEISEQQKWQQSMDMLNTVHEAMTSNWNAYVLWYLKRYYSFIGDGIEDSIDGRILKRGYAFSHYSKFIRPGYIRVGHELDVNRGLQITAYKGEDKVVIVIINSSPGDTNAKLSVKNQVIANAKAYSTDLTKNRMPIDLEVEENAILLSLTSSSVTTVVVDL